MKYFRIIKYKITGLFLLVICYFYSLFRGRANRKELPPRKVLIFQALKVGDTVCTTPIFHALKQKYPKCQVTVFGNQPNKLLLTGNLDIDQYLIDCKNFWRNLQMIRREHFSAAIVISPGFLGTVLLYLSGIPLVVVPTVIGGFSPYETKLYSALLPLLIVKSHHILKYAPREYLNLLEPLNIFTNDTEKHLNYSAEALANIKNFFAENDIDSSRDFIVCLSPSVGNKIKNWGGQKFARLTEYIYNCYQAKIVLIGGQRDRVEVADMLGHLDAKTKIINATDRFDLEGLKALIAQCHLFVGVDTGPIYIAEAFNVPTVDIVGPVDENVQPPRGKYHRVVVPPRKKAELFIMNASQYDEAEAIRQTEATTVEMVTRQLDELIATLGIKISGLL